MFHENEEQEPGRQGNEILYHGPQGNVHDLCKRTGTESRNPVKPVFSVVYPAPGIDHEEDHRYQFGKGRTDGCSGNTQGVAALVEGMDIDEAIKRLKGIKCGPRPTSCPDQLATALEQYKAQQ